VPAGTERVRVCLHAGNTVAQIDKFVECVKQWIIKQGAPDDQAERSIAAHDREGDQTSERPLLAKI
jgi:8-amino-7-oxononanoate synthase